MRILISVFHIYTCVYIHISVGMYFLILPTEKPSKVTRSLNIQVLVYKYHFSLMKIKLGKMQHKSEIPC